MPSHAWSRMNLQRRGNIRVADRKDVRRPASSHAQRREVVAARFDDSAIHQAVQEGRRHVAGAARIRDDARQRRVGQLAELLVVVHAHDRHFVRHGHAGASACLEHFAAHQVVARHDPDGLRQRGDPSSDLLRVQVPLVGVSRRHGQAQHVAGIARTACEPAEALAAPIRPVESVVAAIREMPKAALVEMCEGGLGDRRVIGLHPRHAGQKVGRADVDRRQATRRNRVGDAAVLDSGDDAVAAPMGQPLGRRVAATVFREVRRPGRVRARVLDDAGEQPAGVVVRRLDEKCDRALGFFPIRVHARAEVTRATFGHGSRG